MGKLDIGKESYFQPHLINENRKISNTLFRGDDLDMSIVFPLYAPIICNKDDVEQMLINQITAQENNCVFINTEKLNQIVYSKPFENSYVSNEFYKSRSTFLQLCNLPYEMESVRSMKFDAIHEMLSAFSEIYYNQHQYLTLDKVLYLIADLSTLAIDVKRTYIENPKINIKSMFKYLDIVDELLHFINFFFDIIDKSYPTAIENTFGKSFTEKLEKLKHNNYSCLTEYKQLTQVFTQIKTSIQEDGTFQTFTFDFFVYISLFPIVELLACCYQEDGAKLNTTNYTFSGKENKRNLYLLTICRLFAYIPFFMKERDPFFFDLKLTLTSFVNIGWFTRIFHLCHSDVSWLDEIIFKIFEERLRFLIFHKYKNENIHFEEQKMISLFSLFTNIDDDLQEKLKSISAFCQLKVS